MSDTSSEDLHPHDEGQRTHILVTGANSGLGFAICQRLIDEFVATRPDYQSLTLIITTRDDKKRKDTAHRLQKHISRKTRELESPIATRITLQPENLDLTSLTSVHALAAKLQTGLPHLDTIILNAGIGGVIGVNWPIAIWNNLTDLIGATTYPTYKVTTSGDVTVPQKPSPAVLSYPHPSTPLPPLGQVFTSNVFGHYVLSHLLTPLLLSSPDSGRLIFLSSLEAYGHAFSLSDIQGLRTAKAYESSKRLTDLLVLTSSLPSTSPFTTRFFSPPTSSALASKGIQLLDNVSAKSSSTSLAEESTGIKLTDHTSHTDADTSKPTLYVSHPGICSTSFVPLPLILYYAMTLAFYLARLLGSPWHTISAYKGACAPVWLALTSNEELQDIETEDGKGKWGSSCDWKGRERVVRTGVKGWGTGGRIGEGRIMTANGRGDVGVLDREGREAFEEEGRGVWKEMEELRAFWEGVIRCEESED